MLDDALLRRAKALAAASGRSLNSFIEDAVRTALALRPSRHGTIELPTFRGRGLQAGADLDDTALLLDLMEARPSRRAPRRLAEQSRGRTLRDTFATATGCGPESPLPRRSASPSWC